MKSIRIFYPGLLLIITVFLFSSCVTQKEYDTLNDQYEQCKKDNVSLDNENQKLNAEIDDLKRTIEKLNNDIGKLRRDTSELMRRKQQLDDQYQKLNNMLKSQEEEHAGTVTELQRLLNELQKSQEELIKNEDALHQLEAALNARESELNALSAELSDKEKKLNELQKILDQKDAAVKALRKSVEDALLGFNEQDLHVSVKNGKVYVSLEENLLFESGKYNVSKKGVDALQKLAKVLEENKEINVLVEGHTDNVPYHGTGQLKDNWDLSVMRATSIVKIILQNRNIDPKRLIASGRSEYVPVDPADTPEARSKNRRTEIILTPKLDELFKIIESN